MTSIDLLRDVWNQRQLARALDRRLQLALVRRARARNPARKNLAALRHEWSQQFHVLVVDIVDLVRAKLTDLAAPEQRAFLPVLLVTAASAASAAFRRPSSSFTTH